MRREGRIEGQPPVHRCTCNPINFSVGSMVSEADPKCPDCKGTGWIQEPEEASGRADRYRVDASHL